MTHVRIPDFSQPVPVRRMAARTARRPHTVRTRYQGHADSVPANEALPGEDELWTAVMPIRPDTDHVRAPRFLDLAGEALAALVLVAGGAVLTAIATLV